MQGHYFLAFDQALANTGYAVGFLEDKELTIVDHGVHKTTSEETELERILSIESLAADLVHNYGPIKGYTESVFLRKATPNQGKVLCNIIK